MSETVATIRELTVELPSSAPLIRITAGFGSAGQKTWNLRRPVTVIGSRRPAHIVLHDQDVSNAHCVIVNTGTDVLIKDLHTSSGTWVNKTRVTLATLQDGDVVTLGATNIQVAIHVPEGGADDSACGMEFKDPTRVPAALKLHLVHTEKEWTVEEAVALVGRHDEAGVRLDHPDVSSRHAVLFRFGEGPAVFDLGSRTGLWVNGQRCSLTPLSDLDRLTVGPFALSLQVDENGAAVPRAPAPVPPVPVTAGAVERPAAPRAEAPSTPPKDSPPAGSRPEPQGVGFPGPGEPAMPGEPDLGAMQDNISGAWERLNSWRAQLRHGAKALDEQQSTLAVRETELDARDAALRGQLHDVTRFHEQLVTRERELAARVAQLQAEQDVLAVGKKEAEQRDAELLRREQELLRREHAVAQRWTRLLSTTCPHCSKPISLGGVDSG